MSVLVEVGHERSMNAAGINSAKWFGSKFPVLETEEEVFGGEDDFGKAVAIEIVEDERIDERPFLAIGNGFVGREQEGRLTAAAADGKLGGVDFADGWKFVGRRKWLPLDAKDAFE